MGELSDCVSIRHRFHSFQPSLLFGVQAILKRLESIFQSGGYRTCGSRCRRYRRPRSEHGQHDGASVRIMKRSPKAGKLPVSSTGGTIASRRDMGCRRGRLRSVDVLMVCHAGCKPLSLAAQPIRQRPLWRGSCHRQPGARTLNRALDRGKRTRA